MKMKQSKNNVICIGPQFLFEVNELCYTLYERRISKQGNEYLSEPQYYTSLEALYLRLVDLAPKDCRNFQDIYQRQIDLKAWIAQSIRELVESPSYARLREKAMLAIPRGMEI